MYCDFKYNIETQTFICIQCNIRASKMRQYGPEGPPLRHCPLEQNILPQDLLSKGRRYLNERDITA